MVDPADLAQGLAKDIKEIFHNKNKMGLLKDLNAELKKKHFCASHVQYLFMSLIPVENI